MSSYVCPRTRWSWDVEFWTRAAGAEANFGTRSPVQADSITIDSASPKSAACMTQRLAISACIDKEDTRTKKLLSEIKKNSSQLLRKYRWNTGSSRCSIRPAEVTWAEHTKIDFLSQQKVLEFKSYVHAANVRCSELGRGSTKICHYSPGSARMEVKTSPANYWGPILSRSLPGCWERCVNWVIRYRNQNGSTNASPTWANLLFQKGNSSIVFLTFDSVY